MLLALILRGLAPHITYTMAVDDPERASRGGWVFDEPDPVFGAKDLRCALASPIGAPFDSAAETLPRVCAKRAAAQSCKPSLRPPCSACRELSLPGAHSAHLGRARPRVPGLQDPLVPCTQMLLLMMDGKVHLIKVAGWPIASRAQRRSAGAPQQTVPDDG